MSLELKTCNLCAHVIGHRDHYEDYEKWKCGCPKNIKEEGINLVSGFPYRIFVVEKCVDQRLNAAIANNATIESCGKVGKWFEEYKEPEPAEVIARVGGKLLDL